MFPCHDETVGGGHYQPPTARTKLAAGMSVYINRMTQIYPCAAGVCVYCVELSLLYGQRLKQ